MSEKTNITEYLVVKSLQKWFEGIVDYRLSMTERCFNDSIQKCVYHCKKTGNKCIIGKFIPDGHSAQMCEDGIRTVMSTYPNLFGCSDEDVTRKNFINFLTACQCGLHDLRDTWKDVDRLKRVIVEIVEGSMSLYNTQLFLKPEWDIEQ